MKGYLQALALMLQQRTLHFKHLHQEENCQKSYSKGTPHNFTLPSLEMLDLSFPWDLWSNHMQVTGVLKSDISAVLTQAKSLVCVRSASTHRAQLHGEGAGAATCRRHSQDGPGQRCSRDFRAKRTRE